MSHDAREIWEYKPGEFYIIEERLEKLDRKHSGRRRGCDGHSQAHRGRATGVRTATEDRYATTYAIHQWDTLYVLLIDP